MPSIKPVGGKTQLEIERFDGGLNTKDAPSRIGVFESPDCLNVVFDKQGSVQTRQGCAYFNTSTVETASNAIDGIASYNGTMIVWAGGTMFRSSGTTFVAISGSTAQFTSGVKVVYETYQNELYCSDGTNGPFRYTGADSLYRMGIAVPSAPTGVSNVAGAAPETGTYYYKVSYVNTGVVEGQAGSASVAVTLGTSAAVYVTGIPTPAASLGVGDRYIYRASTSAGTYRRVGTVTGIVASIFTDTMGATTWALSTSATIDATSPTPFTTIKLHKERLWFDDSANRTLLRYTEYTNPYVSLAENYIPLNEGDYKNIVAIAEQDDLVTVFKDNQAWVVDAATPSDDTTFQVAKLPGNLGIVGPRAFCEVPNGLLFVGKLNGKISGFYLLSGLSVMSTSDGAMRTQSISERIERDLLTAKSTLWDDIALQSYNNKVYVSIGLSADTYPAHIYWFDINRLGDKGQPGSWSLWDGRAARVQCFTVHNGLLYAGSAIADGYVLQLEKSATYNDCGAGINSYFWTKQFGGEAAIESWIKDWRKVNMWYGLPGDWNMRLARRFDGDPSDGQSTNVPLDPGGTLWGALTWGVSTWGGGTTETENQFGVPMPNLGRRIQLRFDNSSATTDTYFQVHSVKFLMNMRRQR
jgi:hypothetical protein